jgi:ATP-dependent Lon protease
MADDFSGVDFPMVKLPTHLMVFPGTGSYTYVSDPGTEKLHLELTENKHKYVAAVMYNPDDTEVGKKPSKIGVLCRHETRQDQDGKTIHFEGILRVRILDYSRPDDNSFYTALVASFTDRSERHFIKRNEKLLIRPEYKIKLRSLRLEIKKLLSELLTTMDYIGGRGTEEFNTVSNILKHVDRHNFYVKDSIDFLIWNIVCLVPEIDFTEKYTVLTCNDTIKRIELTLKILSEVIAVHEGLVDIDRKLRGEIYEAPVPEPGQGKLIKINVTGKDSDFNPGKDEDLVELYNRYKEQKEFINDAAQKEILRNFKRLKAMASVKEHATEWPVIKTWMETALDLPWDKRAPIKESLNEVEEVLEKEHYGLDKVKKKISRSLAAKMLNPKAKGSILCLVGPAGVGKTSIAESAARALGRTSVRLALGGMRDEAEIRGHRSTYINAKQGEIIKGLLSSGVKNPVFILDEVDKIGEDFRGDPASALLEVLDPEQNHSFNDHYMSFPFDLSEALFICTANTKLTIKGPLLDRMNLIELPGYDEDEKLQIAKRFLIPKSFNNCGLSKHGVDIKWQNDNLDDLILNIIHGYTRGAGVRGLERCVVELYEELSKKYLNSDPKPSQFTITEELIEEVLGRPRDTRSRVSPTIQGEAIGLAVEASGSGSIIYILAQMFPKVGGGKEISQTGELSPIFRNANKSATTVIKNILEKTNPELLKKFETHGIELSVEDITIPTDGPSAGVTMASALYSELTSKVIKEGVVMTGALTNKGRIRAVGGIKEKVLAAVRFGAKEIILPERNRRDFEDVTEDARKKIIPHFVNDYCEVLPIIFPESTV